MTGAALYDLRERVAVVTGAAGGFGTAISKRLRACGATVVGWDVRAGADEETLKEHYNVDIADETGIEPAAAAKRIMTRSAS